jgi:hypothetical protein
MGHDYAIFECLSDGTVKWCARVVGLREARLKLDGLARETGQDYFAMQLFTREIIFAADISKVTSERASKRILQIAYTEQLRTARAELLRSLGYPVISVIGNDAAKVLLTALQPESLGIAIFVLGHAAPLQSRREMVDWLKANYPEAKIIALNPPDQQLPNADYNALQNGPENWIPFVAATMSPLGST